MEGVPLTIFALTVAAIIMFFSWMNQRTYRQRLSESKQLQEKWQEEVRDMSARHNEALVKELQSIRILLEKRS